MAQKIEGPSLAARRRRLLLAPILLLASCSGGNPAGPSVLTGTRWKLDSLRTADGIVSTVDPERYTLEFLEGKLVTAQADCNVCNGSYKAGSAAITIGPLACTQAFCGADSRGNEYAGLLGDAKVYAQEGTTLILVSNDGTLLYRP